MAKPRVDPTKSRQTYKTAEGDRGGRRAGEPHSAMPSPNCASLLRSAVPVPASSTYPDRLGPGRCLRFLIPKPDMMNESLLSDQIKAEAEPPSGRQPSGGTLRVDATPGNAGIPAGEKVHGGTAQLREAISRSGGFTGMEGTCRDVDGAGKGSPGRRLPRFPSATLASAPRLRPNQGKTPFPLAPSARALAAMPTPDSQTRHDERIHLIRPAFAPLRRGKPNKG